MEKLRFRGNGARGQVNLCPGFGGGRVLSYDRRRIIQRDGIQSDGTAEKGRPCRTNDDDNYRAYDLKSRVFVLRGPAPGESAKNQGKRTRANGVSRDQLKAAQKRSKDENKHA